MAMNAPFPTLDAPLVGEAKPPAFWTGVYVIAAVGALVARAADVPSAFRIFYPVPSMSLLVLVLCWKSKPGWYCVPYARLVVAGLVLQFFGDILIWSPQEINMFHTSFLFFMAAIMCYALATWAPSVTVAHLSDPSVDTSSRAPAAHAAGVPLQLLRAFPSVVGIGAAAMVWQSNAWEEPDEIIPVGVCLTASGLFLWRALARIGYRVPVISSLVNAGPASKRPTRRGPSWEHVDRQWAAVVAAIGLTLSQVLMAYNHLFQDDELEWVPYAAAFVYWLGLAGLGYSVPVAEEPLPDLNDPVVCPPLYDGAGMRVLVFLPLTDFDVTEVAVPWFMLKRRGHEVIFATETGEMPAADPLLLTGVLCGKLGADPLPRQMYFEMERDVSFRNPATWEAVDQGAFDGLLLPGGHAKGMRSYIASPVVHEKVVDFWQKNRPIGAICHGVLTLARCKDPTSNKSILNGATVTCLPEFMEQTAYGLTCLCRGTYYRTYPETVEEEVKAAVGRRGAFLRGPVTFTRGSPWDNTHAFVVEHRHLLSARWPGDAYLFARRFISKLEEMPNLW